MKTKNWIENTGKPLVIAGPCSAENERQMLLTAEHLDPNYVGIFRAGIWKPRTKPNGFEGVGAVGLNWLKRVKSEFGFKTGTEVATAKHVQLALEQEVDVLWIGARTTVNPFAVQEIAEALRDSNKVVLVKNPVNPDVNLWIGALERLAGQGVEKLGAIHRGFSTYKKTAYRNNPLWDLAFEFKNQLPQLPLICDPSHICGQREGIFKVAQQALNFNYDGLMIETHHHPDLAWSDAAQQVTPQRLQKILSDLELRKIDDPNLAFQAQLAQWREQIDDLDLGIIETIARRMQVAGSIGSLKKQHNVAVFQSDRWNLIRENAVKIGGNVGLSVDFMQQLMAAIHQESIEQQNRSFYEK